MSYQPLYDPTGGSDARLYAIQNANQKMLHHIEEERTSSGPPSDADIESLAVEVEDLIFTEGYSIKGGDLRRILREHLRNTPIKEPDTNKNERTQ